MSIGGNTVREGIFFPNLDGLRFFAFLMVFLGHAFTSDLARLSNDQALLSSILILISSGELGVSAFFVLSGFLISFLLINENESAGRVQLGKFYMRRILRIWPLYYLVLFIAFVLYPLLKFYFGNEVPEGPDPLLYTLFLSNFDVINILQTDPERIKLMYSITWSVAIEEQFYLIWPLLFLLFSKRYFPFIFLMIVAASFGFRFGYRHVPFYNYYHSLSVCGDMAVGGLFAYFAYYSQRFRHFFVDVRKSFIAFCYLAGFCWLLMSKNLFGASEFWPFARLVNILFFGFIIMEQNYGRHSLFKFSNNAFVTRWGKYTYGLYLLHTVALYFMEVITLKLLHIDTKEHFLWSLPNAVVVFFISLGMSYVSFHYYEKIFLKAKEKYFSSTRQKTRLAAVEAVAAVPTRSREVVGYPMPVSTGHKDV